MASKRGNDFPATSIGRSSGARMQQPSAAHEAHPLLSPGPSSPSSSEHGVGAGSATPGVNGGPRYVPYTPRQRVVATSATTGTTVHPSSPQQHQGDATSKLQIMHLKAAAQSIGLDSGTLGWLILEKLVLEPEVSEEWVEVWSAITSGKATLLLPLESTSNHGKITADFVKDHLVLADGSSRKSAPIITLSGLRGTLEDETLTFRSTISPTSKTFQDLLNPSTRASTLALLAPLPKSLSDLIPIVYPQYNLPSYTPSLHLPPRAQIGPKPPLPPRPGARATGTTQPSTSRISIPFASLFGGSSSKNTPPIPASPPASLRSFDSTQDGSGAVEVPAFTIDRKIIRRDLAKELNRAVKGELKLALANKPSLGNIPVPGWVMDRVHGVTAEWYPFIKQPSTVSSLQKRLGERAGRDVNGSGYIVNTLEENSDDASEHLQDFYLALEQDMRSGGTSFIPRWRDRTDTESEADDEKDREQREQDRMESETRIREVMEAVEQTITTIFYDRLFMQPTTDDVSHDEALSSRIAALKNLDLGLQHLGIEVPTSMDEEELNTVIKDCGDLLSQLDSYHNPTKKSSLLVAAHKIVVDGLSKLPPIRLISEHDEKQNYEDDLKTAKPTFTSTGEATSQFPGSVLLSTSDDPPTKTNEPFPPSITSPSSKSSASAQPTPTTSSKVKASPPPPLTLSRESTPPASEPRTAHLTRRNPPSDSSDSAPKDPTPVSGDVLLPLIIFSVVKSNPPHLVSNLLFIQRFRNQSVGGEESYCLINLLAVAEFLENVDMAGLGLVDNDRVMSTADLTPITLSRSPITAETPLEPVDQGLRGRVGQQVDAITDSANKVITGVVDSSFGILRSFMPAAGNVTSPGGASAPGTPSLSNMRPGFGLLRRESGFSIASLAASLPITGRSRSNTATEESGQQLLTVSRPSSVRSRASLKSLRIHTRQDDSQDEESEDAEESSATGDEEESEEGEEEDDGDDDDEGADGSGVADARSIRSFESMLSASKRKSKGSKSSRARKSLSDRLASVSALASLKGTESSSRRASLLQAGNVPGNRAKGSPSSSRAASPSPLRQLRLAPPKQRFLNCAPDDLRMSEIAELLREYRRLVDGIRSIGGFEE